MVDEETRFAIIFSFIFILLWALWAAIICISHAASEVTNDNVTYECRNGELWYGQDEHDMRPLKPHKSKGTVKCKVR